MTIGVTAQDVKELHTILYFMIIIIFNKNYYSRLLESLSKNTNS